MGWAVSGKFEIVTQPFVTVHCGCMQYNVVQWWNLDRQTEVCEGETKEKGTDPKRRQ